MGHVGLDDGWSIGRDWMENVIIRWYLHSTVIISNTYVNKNKHNVYCIWLKQKVKDLMSWSYLKSNMRTNWIQITWCIYYIDLISSYRSKHMSSCIIIAIMKSTKLVVTWLDPLVHIFMLTCLSKNRVYSLWWFAPRNEPNMSHLTLFTLSSLRTWQLKSFSFNGRCIFKCHFHCVSIFHDCSPNCHKKPLVALQCFTHSTCTSYFRDCSQLASSHVKKLDALGRSLRLNITLILNAGAAICFDKGSSICFSPLPVVSKALAELRQEGDEVKNGAWPSHNMDKQWANKF